MCTFCETVRKKGILYILLIVIKYVNIFFLNFTIFNVLFKSEDMKIMRWLVWCLVAISVDGEGNYLFN